MGEFYIPLHSLQGESKQQTKKRSSFLQTLFLTFALGISGVALLFFGFGIGLELTPWDLLNLKIFADPELEFPYRPPVEWDITQGHDRKLSYSVSETTWTNLDLSPDGATIIFDVLGDLYTVPVTGGQASLLLGGVPFDRQARYSPDGSRIIFTSDRSGSDNLWTLELKTGQLLQVTNEPYRWVSNANWAPNGTAVVATKWYTSERSIGAGEVWSFALNLSAGPDTGRRLVGRPSFDNQIGPEEPIFTPNGKFIYYSKNTADSSVFQYSKDPNAGIYSIYRYDISSGTSTYVTGGSGGAARPILSRSGTHLAFVRRVPFKNALVIQELETGNEKIVFQGLSWDQQASSAPSGVYPSFTWSRDDSEIILWAQGKIWRVNVASGASSNIPVTVNINLQLAETVRPSVDPSTGTSFTTKVAQGASIGRSSILFTSLGRSYILPLPVAGAPKLVSGTRDSKEELEFGVSVSPNGLQGVQVVWNDARLATVELFTISGSEAPIQLSTKTGRYGFPSFSPLGNSVVFSRFGGDGLSGPFYGLGEGIYVVDLLVSGEEALVVGRLNEPRFICPGSRAIFSADGASLIVQRGSQAVRVFLDGSPERALATGRYATSIAVSPDLGLVAFVDFDDVYLAPLVLGSSGEPMELTTKPGSTPAGLRRLSPNGGDQLSWPVEGSSKSLSFILGSQLSVIAPDDAFACPGDESNDYGVDCIVSKTTTINLSVQVPTNIPQTSIVFDNAVLVTMTGDESSSVIPDGRIVILGDKIKALGPRSQVAIPSGATVIDVQGGVIAPGFIDVHAHWSTSYGYWVQQSWEFIVNLAFGVTTMHNPSIDTIHSFTDAELVRSGVKLGPRLHGTGKILYGASGSYRVEVDDLKSARAALLRLKSYGAWSVKSYNQPQRSVRQMILQAAKELDMAVVPEGGMSYYWNLNQIIDGHTTIEHSLPIAPLYEDVTHLFAQSGTAYTPTLVVSYGNLWGENYWYQNTNVWENEKLMRFSPHREIESRSVQRPKAEDEDYGHFFTASSAKKVHDKGGLVQAGAHGQRQGLGFHWEIWMLAQGGLSNYECLKIATANGADALGLVNIGKLAVGSLADLIIYPPERSPLDDIYNSEHIRYVIKDGRVFEASTMDQLYPFEEKLPSGPALNLPEN